MDLEMVLNELSLRSPAKDVQTARQWMSDLISTVLAATTHGVQRSIRTHSDLHSEELAPGYPVARWLNDNGVDRETRRFFRTLVTKSPFLVDVADPEIQNSVELSDFFCGEDRALGLGIAFRLDALALSLRSEERWLSSHLELRVIQFDDNSEIIEEHVDVIHASHKDHVLEHADWIKRRIRIEVRNGSDLWNYKAELFPNLQFCESVGHQVQALSAGNLMLQPIMKKLHDLENYCKNWHSGPFDPQKITGKITPESPATLERFGHERTFLCPDGQERIFSWHLRLTPRAWRMHFYLVEDKKQLIIGYIGPHLPTVNDPT